MSLESQLRTAFSAFAAALATLDGPQSFARERELVTWFTLGALLPQVADGEVLHNPLQVGIEVACPQRVTETNRRKTPDVCKDIVIWPSAYDVSWDETGLPSHWPLAVIEWKVPIRKDSRGGRTESGVNATSTITPGWSGSWARAGVQKPTRCGAISGCPSRSRSGGSRTERWTPHGSGPACGNRTGRLCVANQRVEQTAR